MSNPTLSVASLEVIYDCLADAINAAGEEKDALFLTKLALLMANQLGDEAQVRALIEQALQDL